VGNRREGVKENQAGGQRRKGAQEEKEDGAMSEFLFLAADDVIYFQYDFGFLVFRFFGLRMAEGAY
jgi:hypothetical protein